MRGDKSRRFFAEELGTKESTLRNYEQGSTQPTADFLVDVCKKLRISPAWLLVGEGPMEKGGEASATCEDVESLKQRVKELEQRNAALEEIAATRREALDAKEEALTVYRQMLSQLQGTMNALEKEGVITTGAPAYVPPAPSTSRAKE